MNLLCIIAPCTGSIWNDVLDALDAVSPLVEDAHEGLAYLQMYGIDGTPHQWIKRAERALQGFSLPLRAAVGPNKFAARAAALAEHGTIWSYDETPARLAPLPLGLLEIDPKIVERFRLLGIQTLGALARLPHGPLVRRFGTQAATWHACARGVDPTPFVPRAHELQIDASLYGEGAADREELIYFALRMLADRVCSDLMRAGKGAACLQVTFECEDDEMYRLDAGVAQSTADARVIFDILRAKIEGQRFASPVTGLRLQAVRLEELGTPMTLFSQREADVQAIGLALARLESAVGARGLQANLQPAHRFEQSFAYEQFTISCNRTISLHCTVTGLPQGQMHRTHLSPQLRLAQREITVIVHNGMPARADRRAVLDCAGPWRVDSHFDDSAERDEFDVLLEDGELYRIYRDGERWYVGGVYD